MNISILSRYRSYKASRGNALFMILIAVVLFAALSFAVTQSGRHGSVQNKSETSLIAASQLIQFGGTLRMGAERMIISGIDPDTITFISNPEADGYGSDGNMFNPDGFGGILAVTMPNSAFTSGTSGAWVARTDIDAADIKIKSVGTTDGEERLAVLPGLTEQVCKIINTRLSIEGEIPSLTIGENAFTTADTDIDLSGVDGVAGQPFMCVKTNDNKFVYYHALTES